MDTKRIMAKMTAKYLKFRKEHILKNIKEDNIYDVAAQYHNKTKRNKDGRKTKVA